MVSMGEAFTATAAIRAELARRQRADELTSTIEKNRAALAAELRAELARRQITQDRFAEMSGISQSTLSRRLNGSLPFSTPELVAVAKALGMSVPASAERAA